VARTAPFKKSSNFWEELEAGVAASRWARPVGGFVWLAGRSSRQTGAYAPFLAPADGPGAQARAYGVLRSRRIFDEFVDLGRAIDRTEADWDAILAFANRWGALGMPVATFPSGKWADLPNGVRQAIAQRTLPGEPIELWRRSAMRLAGLEEVRRQVVQMEGGAGEKDRRLLAEHFPRPREEERGGSAAPKLDGWHFAFGQELVFIRSDFVRPPRDLVERARVALEHVVEQEMRGQLTLMVADHTAIRYVPVNLWASLVWLFAQLLIAATKAPARVCAYCGVEFTPRSSKAKYCKDSHRTLAAYHRKVDAAK
jgi:hypothetical protein